MNAVDELLARVRRTISERELFKGGERVVLAVSGGADSLALLHAFARLAPEYGFELHVAHFDHRLRAGSDRDAVFVAAQARKLGIDATVRAADQNEPVKGQSPEETARTRRLRFLSETAESIAATRIATGHTMDDQAETVLMRVLVGAGRRGLSGIPPRRWYYARPLIDARRAQTEAFCRALKLRPRHDPTNDDPAYLRNEIRKDVLPFLKSTVNARLVESLARLADIERDEDYEMDRRTSSLITPEDTGDGSRLPLPALRELPVALQRRAIRILARNEGPGIDHAHTESVRKLALAGETGKRLNLPGGLSARAEYGFLILGRAPSPDAARDPVVLAIPGETDCEPWDITLRCWIGEERPVAWPDGRQVCVLDADRTNLPLRVRRWHRGDRFRPLGMARPKKVGDFFTDEKVAVSRRGEVPIVATEDEIVWIVGHRIDDRVKATPKTRRFLWMAVQGGTT
jgi:tRNA(Ile)-lysidine synthase